MPRTVICQRLVRGVGVEGLGEAPQKRDLNKVRD